MSNSVSCCKSPFRWIVIACLLILVSLPVPALFLANYFYVRWEESYDIKFDLMLWNSGSKEKIYSDTALHIDAPRIRMCGDFVANQPWRGKTREELMVWLGKPDNFPFSRGWGFNYWVGLQRGLLKMDSLWLCFRFDEAGKAADTMLKQD